MYLLDTDILLLLWQGNQSVKERLLEAEDTEIGITAITKCEVLRARCENLLKADSATLILKAQDRFTRTEQLLSQLTVIPFDESAAQRLGQLQQVRKQKNIGRADLLIASIALANAATLISRNLRHFRPIPGLSVENWAD